MENLCEEIIAAILKKPCDNIAFGSVVSQTLQVIANGGWHISKVITANLLSSFSSVLC